MRKYSFICKVCYGPYSSTHRYSNVCPHCGNKDNNILHHFTRRQLTMERIWQTICECYERKIKKRHK